MKYVRNIINCVCLYPVGLLLNEADTGSQYGCVKIPFQYSMSLFQTTHTGTLAHWPMVNEMYQIASRDTTGYYEQNTHCYFVGVLRLPYYVRIYGTVVKGVVIHMLLEFTVNKD